MSFLFPKTADDNQAKLLAQTKALQDKATGGLDSKAVRRMTQPLLDEKARLANKGLTPVSFAGPSYGINVDSSGNVVMNRSAETQGVMDRLLSGMSADELSYNDLLSQIRPGYGRLTDSLRDAWGRAETKATSNLSDSLARRRVAGSSFANDQLGSLRAEFAKLSNESLAQAMVEELKLTNDVIASRTQARTQSIAQAFDQIQFEGTVGAGLLQTAMTNMMELEKLQVDLTKSAAEMQLQGAIAKAGVSGSMYNTYLGQGSEFAGIDAQEGAAPANFLGTVIGAVASKATSAAGK